MKTLWERSKIINEKQNGGVHTFAAHTSFAQHRCTIEQETFDGCKYKLPLHGMREGKVGGRDGGRVDLAHSFIGPNGPCQS